MKEKIVADVMRPLSEYRTISAESNLFQAAQALDLVQKEFEHHPQVHKVLLISDEHGEIVGKISQLDVLRVLEPKSKPIGKSGSLSRFGVSSRYLKPMVEQCKFWEKPLVDICKDAGKLKVRRLIHEPLEGEFVEADASLAEAIHQLALEHHQSLLVTQRGKIVGVLRQSDIFKEVFEMLVTCEL
ncbi:MAG: CBS domain-containing protein [Desulfobacterales bacterium]|nr:MAG: CBS domain-containing protein [Desulfobacterales bacterium]